VIRNGLQLEQCGGSEQQAEQESNEVEWRARTTVTAT